MGNYYQASNSVVINAGSRTAADAGLYHFTVLTNIVNWAEVKETNSVVDIGFHYVAIDGNGNVLDADGDGIPDYLEDRNGNGTADSGETNWNSADSDGDGVNDFLETLLGRNPLVPNAVADTNDATHLRVFTPLKP